MNSPETARCLTGNETEAEPCATASRSLTTATAVGLPPAPWPLKTTSPPNSPVVMTRFCVPCDQAMGDVLGTRVGADTSLDICTVDADLGDLADGAVELAGVMKVDEADGFDGLRWNLVGVKADLHGGAGKDAELGAGIVAVHVGGRVCFGIACGLRLLEHVVVILAGLHAAENEVAGAVEDAGDTANGIALQAVEHRWNDRDAAGNRGVVDERGIVLACKFDQGRTLVCNELLVGK